jgi:hypothetical protein
MKKIANTTIYGNYSQEISSNFLEFYIYIFRVKSDLMSLFSQITTLFQEKLQIIYENIRV